MNPGKKISSFDGDEASTRKAPISALGGSKTAMVKGNAIKAAKSSVSKANFNHTAKATKTSDWKG